MPIGTISRSGNSFTGAAEYDLAQGKYRTENSKKKPQILDNNLVFSTQYKVIGREFRRVALDNKRCKKPVMKFSISFDPAQTISDELKLEFTKNVMLEMGITDEHQFLITRHSDKEHDHHHIIANRVGLSRDVINDSYSKIRLQTACDKVEKKMGFDNSLAEKRTFVYDENSEKGYTVQSNKNFESTQKKQTKDKRKGVEIKKSFVQNEVEAALAVSTSFNSFYMMLRKKKIDAEMRYNNSGKLTGIAFQFENYSVKGSALGTNFKANNIEKKIQENYFEVISTKSSISTVEDKTTAVDFQAMKLSQKDIAEEILIREDIERINAIINTL